MNLRLASALVHRDIHFLGSVTTIAFTMLLLTACSAPTLRLGQPSGRTTSGSAPTVADLVDHLACELSRTFLDNTNKDIKGVDGNPLADADSHIGRWQRLYDANFVVAVDLNLMVTRAEGFDPLISGTLPLTGAGNRIRPLVYSGSNATSATYNETLAVGFQLNSSADRNVEQDYVVDFRNLIDQYRAVGKTDQEVAKAFDVQQKLHPSLSQSSFPYCLIKKRDGSYSRQKMPPASAAISGSPLQGNMALFETIEDGLVAIERSAPYNTYGSSGPTRWNDAADEFAPSETLPSISVDLSGRLLALANIAAFVSPTSITPQTTTGGGASSSPSKTTFGSKVDFNIAWGPSGGPSITTLGYKLGGGAGGASQLLNYTRTTVDSLTVTFGATCTSTVPLDLSVSVEQSQTHGIIDTAKLGQISTPAPVPNSWAQGMSIVGPKLKASTTIAKISPDRKNITLSQDALGEVKENAAIFEVPLIISAVEAADSTKQYVFPVSLPHSLFVKSPFFADGLFSTISSTRFDPLTVQVNGDTQAIGSIQWTGTVFKDGRFNLRGMVSSGMTGQIVGQVFLKGDSSDYTVGNPTIKNLMLRLPSRLTANLNDDYKLTGYWDSVPSCDVLTAVQKQSAIDAIGLQNQFQNFFTR